MHSQPLDNSSDSVSMACLNLLKLKSLPPRVRLFIWRALNNGLPSKEILVKLNVSTDSLCPLCWVGIESLDHLFIYCQFTCDVWSLTNLVIPPHTNFVTWFNHWMKPPSNSSIHKVPAADFVATVNWFIWKARCDAIFKGKIATPVATLTLAEVYTRLQFPSMTDSGPLFKVTSPYSWFAPPIGTIKINVDASAYFDCSTLGAIARNHSSHHICSFCTLGPPSTILDAEAKAFLEGLRLAQSHGWNNIILESDCLELVLMMHGAIAHRQHLDDIFGECWSLFKCFNSSQVCHVRRTGNICAHKLAQFAYRYICTSFSDNSDGPDHICIDVMLDALQ